MLDIIQNCLMLHYQEEALNPNPQENHPPKSEYFSQYVIQHVIGLVHHLSETASGEDVSTRPAYRRPSHCNPVLRALICPVTALMLILHLNLVLMVS